MFERIARIYDKFTKYAVALAPIVLLIIRLAWGWELFESGRGHLTHLQATTEFFQSLNIPMPHLNAIISGTTEMVGGILWMAGLFTRIISLPLFFNFCVAYVTDARPAVEHIFSDPDKFIDYTAFPFLVCSLILLAFGPGAISLDRLLRAIFRQGKPRS